MGNQGKPLSPTDIALQVSEERYRQRDAMKADNDRLQARVAELEAELATVRTRAENLEESMRFIGLQPCARAAGAPGLLVCSETGDCVTEWCWPCYAKAIVEDRGGMARAFELLEAGGPDCDEATRRMVLSYRDALQRPPSDREVDALCWAWQHGITEGRGKAEKLLRGRMEAHFAVAKSLHEPAPRGESVHGPIFEAIVEANDQRIAAQREAADPEAARVELENVLCEAARDYAEHFEAIDAIDCPTDEQHAALNEAWATLAEAARVWATRTPIPITLWCPNGHRHVDKGAFAVKSHHTHACQTCGITWRPAVVDTVGVQHLPGFKDEEPKPPAKPLRRRTPVQRRERRLATLRRRYEWLVAKENPGDFDKAEASALRWALEQLEARVLSYEIVIDVAHTEAFMVELEKRIRGLASDVEGPAGA
jgi:hypothetical protein